MIDYPVRLSTTEPNNPVGVLKIRQDDKGTQKIVARITTNSKPQDLTGLEVAFNMRTTDGNVVIEKAVVKDPKLGIIEYVVSGFATQKAARNNAYFSFFIGEDEQFSTKDFSYFVTNSVTSEGIRGCDYIWKFEDLLEYVTDLANQAQIQLNKLTSDVEVIQKQIDDMFALIAAQGVLSADEVRQLMINFMSGQDIEVTVKSDFTGKIAGSVLENKNDFRYGLSTATSVQLPTGAWGAGEQVHIDGIKKLDGVSASLSRLGTGVICQWLIKYDLVWILEQNFPLIFKNVSTTAEKINIIKNVVTSLKYDVFGKGQSPANNNIYSSAWKHTDNGYGNNKIVTGTTIQNVGNSLTGDYMKSFFTNEGLLNVVVYANGSNGIVASSVLIDYANIELKVKFNISDFVPTKAQYEALKSLLFQKTDVKTRKVEYINHRGLSAFAPENTIPSFELATGAYGIETDIFPTKDGVWICMHDDTVDRMTDGTGSIKNLTLAQIKALNIDSGTNIANYTNLKVPTFEEYLKCLKKMGVIPVIEIKAANQESDYDSLLDLIIKYDYEHECIIISFDYKALQAIRKRTNNIRLQYLVNSFNDTTINQAVALGYCDMDSTNAVITKALVEKCHKLGMRVNAWTVNDRNVAENLIQLGVDFITTDYPLWQRYEVLTLQNGWKRDPGAVALAVTEIAPNTILLEGVVDGGTRARGTKIADLPEWAKPHQTRWGQVMLRTESGVTVGTSDIRGDGGGIEVGLGWNVGSTWSAYDVIYKRVQ